LVYEICNFGRRIFWWSPIFDIVKTQQAALKLFPFSAIKRDFMGYHLLRFEDIENLKWPKDAPCGATHFTHQTLNSLINICCLNVMVRLKNRRFLMR